MSEATRSIGLQLRTQRLLAVTAACVLATACAAKNAQQPRGLPTAGASVTGQDRDVRDEERIGKASWYGDRFHGRTTANGERYDMNAMTAAHKTLPFGTVVRVIRRDTRQSTVVRVNDRGPYSPGRIIDVSRAAAQELEMIRAGVVDVTLEILQWGDGKRFHNR